MPQEGSQSQTVQDAREDQKIFQEESQAPQIFLCGSLQLGTHLLAYLQGV